MAVVTITIKDDEAGGCLLTAESNPPAPENDGEATPAQLAGAMVMQGMQYLVSQIDAEGKGE